MSSENGSPDRFLRGWCAVLSWQGPCESSLEERLQFVTWRAVALERDKRLLRFAPSTIGLCTLVPSSPSTTMSSERLCTLLFVAQLYTEHGLPQPPLVSVEFTDVRLELPHDGDYVR